MANELTTQQTGELLQTINRQDLGELLQPLIREIHLFDTYVAGTTHLKDPTVLTQIKENDRVFFFDRGKYQLILNLSKKDYELNETVVFGCNEDENYLKTKEAVLVERRERK